MFQDSTFLAERPSADESTVSNTLPFDFAKPDSTSDSEQSNDNEIRPRPENLDSEASLAPEAPLSSEADVTSLPDGLNLEDGNQTPQLVTGPVLGRDSVDSLEWLSAPSSLDGKLMPLTEVKFGCQCLVILTQGIVHQNDFSERSKQLVIFL